MKEVSSFKVQVSRLLVLWVLAGLVEAASAQYPPRVVDMLIAGVPKASAGMSNITSGLIAWYKLDEGSGTSTADAVGGFTCYQTNAPVWTNGLLNGATYLAGNAYYRSAATTATIAAGTTGTFTYAAWIYPQFTTNENGKAVMDFADVDGGHRIYMRWEGGGNGLYVDAAGYNGWYCKTTAIAWYPSTWHHIVMTRSSSTFKMYWDGESVAVSTGGWSNASESNLKFAIGYGVCNSYYWTGRIDDVRVYNRAIDAGEVTVLYNYRP